MLVDGTENKSVNLGVPTDLSDSLSEKETVDSSIESATVNENDEVATTDEEQEDVNALQEELKYIHIFSHKITHVKT